MTGPMYNQMPDGRWGRSIGRYLGMLGANPVPTAGPELIPVIVAQPAEQDHYYLRDEFWYGIALAQNGGATSSEIGLRNPATSKILVVLRRASFVVSAAGNVLLAVSQTGTVPFTGNDTTAIPLDRRTKTSLSQAVVSSRNSNSVAGYSSVWQGAGSANATIIDTPIGIVLPPGTGLLFQSVTVATNMQVNLAWSEHNLQPDEL